MNWPPSDNEVSALLVTAKVCKTPLDCTGAVAQAVAELEDLTGWHPFVSDGKTVSRRIDPPDAGRLRLPWGFLTVDSVYIGVTDDDPGSLLTQDTDYRLEPSGASYNGDPFDVIDGDRLTGRTPRSVQVTGTVGRMAANDPRVSEVRRQVLRRAAANFFFEAKGEDGTVKRLKQGPVDIEYSDREGLSRIEDWRDGFAKFCARYRRNQV